MFLQPGRGLKGALFQARGSVSSMHSARDRRSADLGIRMVGEMPADGPGDAMAGGGGEGQNRRGRVSQGR